MQKNKVKHLADNRVLRPHVPGWDYEQRRIHRLRRRLKQAPWWLWALTAAILLATVFSAGTLWSGGRSSALAEQLTAAQTALSELSAERDGLVQQSQQLQAALAAAPTPAEVEQIEAQLAVLNQELIAKDEAIAGWAGRVEALQAQVDRQQRLIDLQQDMVRTQTERAETLQAVWSAERAGIPLAVADVLRTADIGVKAEHFVGLEWQIERSWFGDANDETHRFQNSHGQVEYRPLPSPVVGYWDGDEVVVSLGLPEVDGDPAFVLAATDLQPNSGFLVDLAHFLGQDTNLQPLLAEADNRLGELACQDIQSLRLFVARAQTLAEAAARGQAVQLRWRDRSGLYHSVVSDQMLLDNVC